MTHRLAIPFLLLAGSGLMLASARQPPDAQAMQPPATGVGPPMPESQPTQAAAPMQFLMHAYDEALSQRRLALKVARTTSNPAVRAFAETLARDMHNTISAIHGLARSKGIQLPPAPEAGMPQGLQPAPEQAAAPAPGQGAAASASDMAFLQHESRILSKAVDDFHAEMASGTDSDVARFAELQWGTLKTLHYMAKVAIQDLQKQE